MDSDAWSTTSLGKFSIFKTLFRFNHFKEDSSDNGTSLLWCHESEILKLRTSKDLEYHRESPTACEWCLWFGKINRLAEFLSYSASGGLRKI